MKQPRIPWTKNVINEEFYKKVGITRKLIYNHKEIVDISLVYHEKRMSRKFNLHWTY